MGIGVTGCSMIVNVSTLVWILASSGWVSYNEFLPPRWYCVQVSSTKSRTLFFSGSQDVKITPAGCPDTAETGWNRCVVTPEAGQKKCNRESSSAWFSVSCIRNKMHERCALTYEYISALCHVDFWQFPYSCWFWYINSCCQARKPCKNGNNG